MRHLSLTLRALVLLPLLAVGADQTRAAVLCGPRAESCLQAAGSGWSTVGVLALALYGIGLALLVARVAGAAPGFARLWALATGASGSPAARRPRSPPARRGLRARRRLARAAGARRPRRRRARARAAGRARRRALVRSLRTAAPRLQLLAAIASRPLQRSPMGASAARLRLTRGRAPPVAA